MDCSPPGSSVHGILQARILEWVPIPFFQGSSQPRDWTQVSCTAGRFFAMWITRKALLVFFVASDSCCSKSFTGSSFSVAWHSWCSKAPTSWGPSLLLSTACAQSAPLAGILLFAPQIRHSKICPLWGLSLSVSRQHRCVGKERLQWWPTACAWLSSAALLPRLPCFPPKVFPTVISLMPSPAVSVQLAPDLTLGLLSIPHTPVSAATHSRRLASLSGACRAAEGLSVWLLLHSLSQISCCTVPSASNASPLSETVGLTWGSDPNPWMEVQSCSLSFFPFLPSSYWTLCGSIYSFPMVRDSCRLSTGFLWDLVHRKMYSWCTCGERCTPMSTIFSLIPLFFPLVFLFLI